MEKYRGWRVRGCGMHRGIKKCLCALGCFAAGVLVLICFLPDWLLAVVLAGILFCLACALIGRCR